MKSADPVVQADDLSKRFGARRALDRISFTLAEGEILSLFGPNGAGKTTLFRMITGQESAESGVFNIGETVRLA